MTTLRSVLSSSVSLVLADVFGGTNGSPPAPPTFTAPVPSFTGTMTSVSGEDDVNYNYYGLYDDGQLTFDKACTFDLECIPSGGTAGGGQYQNTGGGGGGSYPFYSTHTVSAGAVLNFSLGAPGAKSGYGSAPNPGTGITVPELSISYDPGGTGGNGSGTAAHRYGLAGSSGGGANQAITNPIYNAVGDPGGDGSVNPTGTRKQAGSGGGAAGDALPAIDPNRSTPGAGVVSWLGDTVCAGGQGGWNQEVKNGEDATGYGCGGEGGSMTSTQSVTGGLGGPPRVVVRVAKSVALSEQDLTAETVYNVPYPLNATLTSAQVPLAFTTNVDGTYEARPVYHADETPAGSWISLGSVSGSFDGTVTVPVCDAAVRWEVRRVGEPDGRTFVQQGTPWLTCFTMLAGGQSNMVGWWPGAKDSVAEDGTEALSQAYACFVAADNSEANVQYIYGLNYCNSTALRNFTEEWYNATGIPICVMHGGRGSSRIRTHVASWDATPDYSIFSKYQQALELIGYCHAIYWYQGEADAVDDASYYAQYVADAETLRSDVATVTGQTATDIVWLCTDLATWSGATTPQIELWQDFKLLQKDWENQMTTGFCRLINGDFVRKDAFHTSMNEGGYDRLGSRAGVIMAWAMGQTADPGRFRVTAGTVVDDYTTDFTVAHNSYGTDFSFVSLDHEADPVKYYPDAAATSTTLFQVSEDGGTTPVSGTATRIDANTIRFVTVSAVSQATRSYRVRGDAAVDEAVVDNSAYTFPLEFTGWTACA